MTPVNFLLFDDFETLDLFGPVEILGRVESFRLNYYSLNGGIIQSRQKTSIATQHIREADRSGILLIPGGQGTRTMIRDEAFISTIYSIAQEASYCLTVCTGSALLARTGLLKHRQATSNKKAFEWVRSVDPDVFWMEKARWTTDGKFYTSSGVSAGIDMALGFITDLLGDNSASEIAGQIEYIRNPDKTSDPFAL